MFLEEQSEIRRKIAEVVGDEGFELYDLEQQGFSLRVTISSESGVSSQDCSRVCKRLAVFLSVEGEALNVSSEPRLEVSSPGVNRALRSKQHFMGAVGERVKVVCSSLPGVEKEDESRSNVCGLLELVENEELKIRDERTNSLVCLSLAEVKKARVDFKF
jgi:ribosome maturation factor RimP